MSLANLQIHLHLASVYEVEEAYSSVTVGRTIQVQKIVLTDEGEGIIRDRHIGRRSSDFPGQPIENVIAWGDALSIGSAERTGGADLFGSLGVRVMLDLPFARPVQGRVGIVERQHKPIIVVDAVVGILRIRAAGSDTVGKHIEMDGFA